MKILLLGLFTLISIPSFASYTCITTPIEKNDTTLKVLPSSILLQGKPGEGDKVVENGNRLIQINETSFITLINSSSVENSMTFYIVYNYAPDASNRWIIKSEILKKVYMDGNQIAEIEIMDSKFKLMFMCNIH